MRNCQTLVLFVVVALLPGCGESKIDASSDEKLKTSVQKIRDALPESKRDAFEEAVKVVTLSKLELKDVLSGAATKPGAFEETLRLSLGGKTAEQVIAEADRIRADRLEKERQQAIAEIAELEAKKTSAEVARESLKKFVVTRSRFSLKEREYSGKQPIIHLTVKNGTDKAVARAYFEGTIASPNRSVPWLKDTFNHSISGGLEPGEEATWNLAPNMFSSWGKVEPPTDAVFTVTVEQLDGADDSPIFSTKGFDEDDRKRLDELKSKYHIEK